MAIGFTLVVAFAGGCDCCYVWFCAVVAVAAWVCWFGCCGWCIVVCYGLVVDIRLFGFGVVICIKEWCVLWGLLCYSASGLF